MTTSRYDRLPQIGSHVQCRGLIYRCSSMRVQHETQLTELVVSRVRAVRRPYYDCSKNVNNAWRENTLTDRWRWDGAFTVMERLAWTALIPVGPRWPRDGIMCFQRRTRDFRTVFPAIYRRRIRSGCARLNVYTITTVWTFRKLAPYGDWRSTLRNGRLCQLQSHVTQKLSRIWKIRPEQI